ncbi:MAG: T9SS type A sorting domain-containing protein [Bacteroidota bacterium]
MTWPLIVRWCLFALILCSAGGARAQAPDTLWTRTFGGTNIDVGHAVAETRSGGFVVAGYTRSFGTMGGRNVLLIGTDASGRNEWIRAFGGDADDEGYAVDQTSDGGLIVAGYTKSFGAGLKDVILIRTDSAGNALWTRTFGGAQDDEGYGVQQTSDGGYIVGGVTSSYGAGSRDLWLIKTDTMGYEVWKKTAGGLGSDGAWAVEQTPDGGYAATGWTMSGAAGPLGDMWLVKADTGGNQRWAARFGGSDADRGHAMRRTADGGYIVTGYTSSWGAGLDDLLLVKTDSAGGGGWTKTLGGTGRDYGRAVEEVPGGGYVIAGYTLSYGAGSEDFWIIRTDQAGNMLWSKTLGGTASDMAYGLDRTFDGGYVAVGHTLSSGAGVHDVWLVRLAAEATSAGGEPAIPQRFGLLRSYPNPFNVSCRIAYALPEAGEVEMKVFDLLGREVAVPLKGRQDAGSHAVDFDGSGLGGGVYLYRLRSGSRTAVGRMVLVK